MLNEIYTKKAAIAQINKQLATQGMIQLPNFFDAKTLKVLEQELNKMQLAQTSKPIECKFKSAKKVTSVHKIIHTFVQICTAQQLTSKSSTMYQLAHRDFSMIPDTVKPTKKIEIDVIIDLTKKWNFKAGGDVVYNTDGESLRIPTQYNSVSIVIKQPGTRHFFAYANHYANVKKIIIITYSL